MWDIEIFKAFLSYTGGQRGSVSLPHILKFATGAEEEPVLGFSYHPFITFVEAGKSFLPTANTCINCLKLVRPTLSKPLPSEDALFQCFDYAFANAYFGNL